ncbi:MAG: hypothetical protein MI923_07890 [Phycisphaerales bacterium]|nr:hypothetical protein [Phycisphaerales bacterium]
MAIFGYRRSDVPIRGEIEFQVGKFCRSISIGRAGDRLCTSGGRGGSGHRDKAGRLA